jgi:inhibitor of KinA sporulation pathway (predicted exonuclease)
MKEVNNRDEHASKAYAEMEQSRVVDFLCILDFEATCCKGKLPKLQEIIEFPTLLLHVETMKVEGEFDYYQTRCEPWTRSLLQS